ncbi:MAG TPA: hypothetical protein VK968_15480, partial [Roseimicrobium sp.]|nr:hypothetical protein [Roseimicrobium sp.]
MPVVYLKPEPKETAEGCFIFFLAVLLLAGLLTAIFAVPWITRCVGGGFALLMGLAIYGTRITAQKKKKRDEDIARQTQAIPIRSFDGWLKCHRAEQRNQLGDLVMKMGFPLFNGVNVAGGVQSEDPGEDPYNAVMAKHLGGMGADVIHLPNEGKLHRRYAGDMGQIHTLDRGRYYTVCLDEEGRDGNTLANEINSYADPLGSFVMAFDLAYPNAMFDKQMPALAVVASSIPGMPSSIIEEATQRGMMPPDTTRAFAHIPYRVSRMTIEKVLDLRYPDAQRWLFEQFGGGEVRGVDFHGKGEIPTVQYMGRKLSDEEGFFGLLPTLLGNDTGGNELTDTIGAFLRNRGVDALIFPSARSNVTAVFDNGHLVHWEGWNLVDFRDATSQPPERILMRPTDWDSFLDPRQQIVRASPEESSAGSFRLLGQINHHLLLRHFLLCTRVWDNLSDDTEVQGYRWHATKSVAHGEKRIFNAACCSCGHRIDVHFL